MSYFPSDLRSQVAIDLSLALAGIVSQRLLPREGTGRVVAVELCTVTPAAARLIREQRLDELVDLIKASPDPGMVPFNRSLLELYTAGEITHEVGLCYATNREEFALNAQGIHSGPRRGSSGDAQVPVNLEQSLRTLLKAMQTQEASDLHISVGRPPMLRVAGRLMPLDVPALSPGEVRLLLYSVLTVRQRSVYELERELDFALSLPDGQRCRVNAYHENGNMAAAFRAIPAKVPDIETLGLPRQLLSMGREPHGLVLVVGPTGSGKTTSLAYLVDQINRTRQCHVISVEDPIEYTHQSDQATIHQREVGHDTMSFAAALKYVLRQDPDVIVIGELRDLETISMALTAAETGHLVLCTLHTNNAVLTIDRLVDVFPPHQQEQARTQLAASLIGVVSQRLLPRVDHSGRVAAFEVMLATPALRTMIRDNKMHQAMSYLQSGKAQGMQTLDDDLARLYHAGVVSKEAAAHYISNEALLES